jgi:ATP-dependent RNA helicase DeaD
VSNDAVSKTFADLGLSPDLVSALSDLGYEEPTPIQSAAIPPLLEGADLLGQAATGTGKTAAFALPILQRLSETERGKHPTAMVLVPTRELCMQVSEAMHKYGKRINARVLPIYGGQPVVRQIRELERGVDVVVATPGRALDLISRRSLNLERIRSVVLDEADEMLDMGFAEEIEGILSALTSTPQTVLFSATMPARLGAITRKYLNSPQRIEIEREVPAAGAAPRVRQTGYMVTRAHKPAALGRILDIEAPTAAIVFCRTRDEVDRLAETLNGRGYRAEALHGGMDQNQRDRVMGRVRSGASELLVATDVAARGLDIDSLTHVVNYDVPSAVEPYVHRIGRVGRGGREGVAITLAEPREHRQLKAIERVTKQKITIEKIPTTADLQARRLELTRASLQEVLLDDTLDSYRVVVETLTDEFDLMQVALAAVKLAHEASTSAGTDDEDDIPEARPVIERPSSGRDRGRPAGKAAPHRGRGGDTARIWIGAGRKAGIRPQDLVGAIAGESRLSGRDVGGIEIADAFSLVDIPADAVDEVIDALSKTRIKGKRVKVKRDGAGSRR